MKIELLWRQSGEGEGKERWALSPALPHSLTACFGGLEGRL